VLSIGHESALLYTMLAFMGWLTVEDLKEFRQLHSKTPGHPERGLTPGVEATTGPLGQGIGNAVGMAVSEEILRAQFGKEAVNHYTYVLHGDGDIQEPVAQGAVALAGHWGLGKLIAYYDSNDAQISGKVSRSDSTNYSELYKSNGWHVIEIDGHDRSAIRDALRQAQMEIEKPSIIIGHTIMAQGCANVEGDHNTHGAPLSHEEIFQTKKKMELNPESYFDLPNDVLNEFQSSYNYARDEVSAWQHRIGKLSENADFKDRWEIMLSGQLPNMDWPTFNYGDKIATRKVWGAVIEPLCNNMDNLVGGSADLEPSNVTAGFAKIVGDFNKKNRFGRNFAYGVREFPMGAINNGIAQHGGLKVFGATFFVFSDYERPALRLRALQNLPAISEYTHDSIYVGEDGPTHQPVEHIMSCRAIPNLQVLRPCDANEAVIATKYAFEQTNVATIILLTRQAIPVIDREIYESEQNFVKGAYVISECQSNPEIVIFATGSEVHLALEAKEILKEYQIRVVNVPCWELFDKQSDEYVKSLLHYKDALLVSVEAGITDGWQKYTGRFGLNIGINSFGESGPGTEVADYFGITTNSIVKKIKARMTNKVLSN